MARGGRSRGRSPRSGAALGEHAVARRARGSGRGDGLGAAVPQLRRRRPTRLERSGHGAVSRRARVAAAAAASIDRPAVDPELGGRRDAAAARRPRSMPSRSLGRQPRSLRGRCRRVLGQAAPAPGGGARRKLRLGSCAARRCPRGLGLHRLMVVLPAATSGPWQCSLVVPRSASSESSCRAVAAERPLPPPRRSGTPARRRRPSLVPADEPSTQSQASTSTPFGEARQHGINV